jgi:hypothetical protein
LRYSISDALGGKEDYESILKRQDKLEEYGSEPAQFAALLEPILRRMIRTFEEPTEKIVIDFWQRVLHGTKAPTRHVKIEKSNGLNEQDD